MNAIPGIPLPNLPISGLRHVRDLIYFDGPLLSHFEHPNGDDYLYYWCDCDDTANRWMVLRVAEASILRLINHIATLDSVVPRGCRDDYVYIVDLASDGKPIQTILTPVPSIPSDYHPAEGTYLEMIPSAVSDRLYSVLVDGGWSVKEVGEFPSLFAKVYSTLYNLTKFPGTMFEGFPWRGGFSALHFFRWLSDNIPAGDRPKLSAMQYSSPGFMRFELDGPTADIVTQCVRSFRSNRERIWSLYLSLGELIRKNKLNEIRGVDSPEWLNHNEPLRQHAVEIMGSFPGINADLFVESCPRPFEAAKIAMAFVRYVKGLTNFESEGLVRFPRNVSV